jgi:lactate dehydrogenase-like 2-hydroxyacid dehydrogenase
MKLIAYNCRSDERVYFEKFAKQYGVDLTLTREAPTAETVSAAEGCPCISIITTPMTRELLQMYYDVGVRFISTRSIGYDHIDRKAAQEIGMHIGNVRYAPESVADYTIMLALMATRKIKKIVLRSEAQDFSLAGVRGTELHNLTVGIIGTGRIGGVVAQRFAAFGCRVIAYDLHQNDSLKGFVEYVPLPRLFAESDLITLHMPATKENYHIINAEAIAAMKDGVYLINTARGSLIDTQALMDGVESGKIGGAALDVIENESGLYYNNLKNEILTNRERAVLKSYPNVIVLPHTAFYTDQAVSDMVKHSMESCLLFTEGKKNPWQIV